MASAVGGLPGPHTAAITRGRSTSSSLRSEFTARYCARAHADALRVQVSRFGVCASVVSNVGAPHTLHTQNSSQEPAAAHAWQHRARHLDGG